MNVRPRFNRLARFKKKEQATLMYHLFHHLDKLARFGVLRPDTLRKFTTTYRGYETSR